MGARTWAARWATEGMQYAYDTGVFEGVAVFVGLMGMAEAIRARRPRFQCVLCGLPLSIVEDELFWVGNSGPFCSKQCAAPPNGKSTEDT
jgi:hypothetical protein